MIRHLALCGLMIVVLAVPSAAQESRFPRLADHQFVPATSIPEPFINTNIQTIVGLGFTTNSTSPLISPEDGTVIGSVESDQVLSNIGLQYQHRVKEWLAVRLSLDIAGRLGTDSNSLLSDGITGSINYDVSWLMRIHSSESVLVSGSLGIGSSSSTFINVLDWLQGQEEGKNTGLVQPHTSLDGFAGVHAAWGMSRRFGVLGSIEANYGESRDGSGDNAWYSDFRLALSYDISQDLNIPLGLALTGARSENEVNADSEAATWFWGLRVAVQAGSDFSIGLGIGTSYFDSSGQSDALQFTQIAFDMRYFF
jgi:hypothetical protein